MPFNFAPFNPEISTQTDLNPALCKRRDYTPGLACATLPSETDKEWKELALQLRALYSALGNHQAMIPNLDQTFDTPASSKNAVYFIWDFVGGLCDNALIWRMLYQRSPMQHHLYVVPAKLQGLSDGQKEMWQDTRGRSVMAANLVLGNPPGMLSGMMGGQEVPKMGKEVENAVKALLAD